MSTAQLAAVRTLAETVAAQNPAFAVTEYERAAISLARAVLALLDERQRLSAIAEHAGRPILHPYHDAAED